MSDEQVFTFLQSFSEELKERKIVKVDEIAEYSKVVEKDCECYQHN